MPVKSTPLLKRKKGARFQSGFGRVRHLVLEPLLKRNEDARFQRLEKEVVSLRDRLATLEQAMPTTVPIETLAPEPYEVLKPFHVVVQAAQDDYIASFFDASLSASGDTQDEAVYNLKDILIAAFDSLGEHREDQLGPGPRRQLTVLKEFIRKTG